MRKFIFCCFTHTTHMHNLYLENNALTSVKLGIIQLVIIIKKIFGDILRFYFAVKCRITQDHKKMRHVADFALDSAIAELRKTGGTE